MDLSSAIAKSFDTIRQSAQMVGAPEPRMTRFWFNELVIETGAYQPSIQKVFSSFEMPLNSQLKALLKSMELEDSSIVNLARQISERMESMDHPRSLKKNLSMLEVHLRRHEIKGKYVQQHLAEFFDQESLEKLGEEFYSEHQALAGRMHVMDFGG
jgi:hypothetical protein